MKCWVCVNGLNQLCFFKATTDQCDRANHQKNEAIQFIYFFHQNKIAGVKITVMYIFVVDGSAILRNTASPETHTLSSTISCLFQSLRLNLDGELKGLFLICFDSKDIEALLKHTHRHARAHTHFPRLGNAFVTRHSPDDAERHVALCFPVPGQ